MIGWSRASLLTEKVLYAERADVDRIIACLRARSGHQRLMIAAGSTVRVAWRFRRQLADHLEAESMIMPYHRSYNPWRFV